MPTVQISENNIPEVKTAPILSNNDQHPTNENLANPLSSFEINVQMQPQATKEGEYEVKNKPTTCKKEVKKEVAQKKKKEKKRKKKIEESDSDEVVEVDDEKHLEVNARPLIKG
ncbi:O-fucosyltransferase 16 [Bienertia sinuspersici]